MSYRAKMAIGVLVVAVLVAAFYLPGLVRHVFRLARPERTEEQAQREVTQPPVITPTDVNVKAKIFWASTTSPGIVEPVEVQLPLSADPVQRSRQLINALITQVPAPEQRTLPADTTLLELYLLSDGTAVADFSDSLSAATPSGILSEQIAVDSITRTLAANVEPVRRLKILIHGQDTETLAGHLDLTGFFLVRAESPPTPPTPPAGPGRKAAASGLTPPAAPGKLAH